MKMLLKYSMMMKMREANIAIFLGRRTTRTISRRLRTLRKKTKILKVEVPLNRINS